MKTRPCGQRPPNENALVDDDLSIFQLEEANERLELPRLVACSRLGVMWAERRKSTVQRKQPRQYTPDRQRSAEPFGALLLQCCRGLEDVWHTHPMGEADEPRKTVLTQASEDATVIDTMAGRVHVRRDETTPSPVLTVPE